VGMAGLLYAIYDDIGYLRWASARGSHLVERAFRELSPDDSCLQENCMYNTRLVIEPSLNFLGFVCVFL
jgi:hypothetical protein